jgi:hypothetical protein
MWGDYVGKEVVTGIDARLFQNFLAGMRQKFTS